MGIEIKKSDNAEYKPQLKMSKVQPFEYVVLEKHEFAEPNIGEGKYGAYYLYTVAVHEYKTMDVSTGEIKEEKLAEPAVCSYFASKTAHEGLENLPLGVKVKITSEVKQNKKGNDYNVFKVTPLDKVESGATPATTNADVTLDEKITGLKKAGTPVEDVVNTVGPQYDVSADFIRKRYNEL